MAGHWSKNLTKRMAMGMKIVVNKSEIQRVKVDNLVLQIGPILLVND